MAGANSKVRGLQMWCKRQCEGYRDVEITNMTSSWKSGLAFCAMIHRYRPDIIDYDSLSKENVYDNNKLAFDTAQRELGIPALLDAEDMVAMAVPDKLCVVTYVAQYHNYFRDKEPVGGPHVSSRQTTKRPTETTPAAPPPDPKRPAASSTQKTGVASTAQTANSKSTGGQPPQRRATYGDTCCICGQKVYLLERHIDGNKLYHRRCLRENQRNQLSPSGSLRQSLRKSQEKGISASGASVRKLEFSDKNSHTSNSNNFNGNQGGDKPKDTKGSVISMLNRGPQPYGSSIFKDGAKTTASPHSTPSNLWNDKSTGQKKVEQTTRPKHLQSSSYQSKLTNGHATSIPKASSDARPKPYGQAKQEKSNANDVDKQSSVSERSKMFGGTKLETSSPKSSVGVKIGGLGIANVNLQPSRTSPSAFKMETSSQKTSVGMNVGGLGNAAVSSQPSRSSPSAFKTISKPPPRQEESMQVDSDRSTKYTKPYTLGFQSPQPNSSTNPSHKSEPKTRLVSAPQRNSPSSRPQKSTEEKRIVTGLMSNLANIRKQGQSASNIASKSSQDSDKSVVDTKRSTRQSRPQLRKSYDTTDGGERSTKSIMHQGGKVSLNASTDRPQRSVQKHVNISSSPPNVSVLTNSSSGEESPQPFHRFGGPRQSMNPDAPRPILKPTHPSTEEEALPQRSRSKENQAPRPILKTRKSSESLDDPPSAQDSVGPQPILKWGDEMLRSRSSSPPKSILKHNQMEETVPITVIPDERESKPVKSILKSKDSPEMKDEEETYGHISRYTSILKPMSPEELRDMSPSRVTSAGRSILKKSLDEEIMDASESVDIEVEDGHSTSPHRSILKNSQEYRRSSDPGMRVTSPMRSILKSSGSAEDKSVEDLVSYTNDQVDGDNWTNTTEWSPSGRDSTSPKSILKKSDQTEVDSLHPILKHTSPSRGDGGDGNDRTGSSKSPLAFIQSSRSTTSPRADPLNKNSPITTFTDTKFPENEDTKALHFKPAPTLGEGARPKYIPSPKGPSLLPSTGSAFSSVGTTDGYPNSKSSWNKPLPKAEVSDGVPQVSASMSASHHPLSSASRGLNLSNHSSKTSSDNSSTKPDQSTHPVNNFSAFNLKDSVHLGGRRNKGASSKPVWQIEMEARQGMNQKPDIATTIARQMASTTHHTDLATQLASISASSEKQVVNGYKSDNVSRHQAVIDGHREANISHSNAPYKTPKDTHSKESDIPEWQREAERRQAARNGKYDDPEKKWMWDKNNSATEKMDTLEKLDLGDRAKSGFGEDTSLEGRQDVMYVSNDRSPPPVIPPRSKRAQRVSGVGWSQPSYGGLNMAGIVQRQLDTTRSPTTSSPLSSPDTNSTPPGERRTNLIRSPAFRITDDTSSGSSSSTSGSESSPDINNSRDLARGAYETIPADGSGRRKIPAGDLRVSMNPFDSTIPNSPPPTGNLKRVVPDQSFNFRSTEFDLSLNKLDGLSPPGAPVPSYPQSWMQSRPLPPTPDNNFHIPKRRVNAEVRLSTVEILQHLEELDSQLGQLELEGRQLEEDIRQASDEAMDEDDLMIQWFELVNCKNELVRKESDYMYRQRQQELEDLHEELEYEFRCLMDMPEHEKTASDKVREEGLLQELLDTINLRNHIIDSIEEDRIRYIEEDQEIAEVLARKAMKKTDPPKKKNSKKKKKDKKKKDLSKKTRASHFYSDSGNGDEADGGSTPTEQKDRKSIKISMGSSGS